jgi:hypothetical protein
LGWAVNAIELEYLGPLIQDVPGRIFPVQNRNRQFGWEKSPTDFAPVPADFSWFFPRFLIFLTKRSAVGFHGSRCRTGRDFPVPFSSLVVEGSEIYNFGIHCSVHFSSNFWSKSWSNWATPQRVALEWDVAPLLSARARHAPYRRLGIRSTRWPRPHAFPRRHAHRGYP